MCKIDLKNVLFFSSHKQNSQEIHLFCVERQVIRVSLPTGRVSSFDIYKTIKSTSCIDSLVELSPDSLCRRHVNVCLLGVKINPSSRHSNLPPAKVKICWEPKEVFSRNFPENGVSRGDNRLKLLTLYRQSC